MIQKIIGFGKLHCLVFILPILALIIFIGCDNQYYDERLQMRVQKLDSDLMNRWSTSGVVVTEVTPNGAGGSGGT